MKNFLDDTQMLDSIISNLKKDYNKLYGMFHPEIWMLIQFVIFVVLVIAGLEYAVLHYNC